ASTAPASHNTHPASNPTYPAAESQPQDQLPHPPDPLPPCSMRKYSQSVAVLCAAKRMSRHGSLHSASSQARGTRLLPRQASAAPTESNILAKHPAAHGKSRFRRSSRPPPRKDRCLNPPRPAAPAQHPGEKPRHLIQSSTSRNVLRALEPPASNQAKRSPASCRRMM